MSDAFYPGEHGDLLDEVDQLKAALREMAKLARREHYYCEDTWYSCPLADPDRIETGEECECSAEDHNAEVDALMRSAFGDDWTEKGDRHE